MNTVEGLNQGRYCRTLNAERLREQLEGDSSLASLASYRAGVVEVPEVGRSPARRAS